MSSSTNDKVSGLGNQAGGTIKEGVGNLTGDKQTQTEGQAQNLKGKVQETLGDAKDAVANAAHKVADAVKGKS